MVAVAVIMSIFSVAVLVGFFIVEKTFAARKQK